MAFLNDTKPNVAGWHPALPADIVEPLAGIKTTGHQEQEYPPYEWINWFWDNVSYWIDYIDDQSDSGETTTKNDTHATPADATAYADAQAYLDSLPRFINHDISLNLNGTGYTTQTLTIQNHLGTGRILITDIAMGDNIQNIDMQDCQVEVFFSSMTIDGNSVANGVDMFDCSQVEFSFCTFQECTNIINASKNSFIKWTNSTIGATNVNFVKLSGNCKLEVGTLTQTAALTGYAYDCDDGAIVTVSNDNFVYTSSTTPVRFYDGAIFSGIFGLNGEGFTADRTIALTAGHMPYVNSIIATLGKYIPPDRKLTFTFPNYTGAVDDNKLNIKGYWGGGSAEFIGNGAGTTFNASDQVIITGNECDILVQDIDLIDAGNTSNYELNNNKGYVYILNPTIQVGAFSFNSAIEIRRCSFVHVDNANIPNSNHSNGIYAFYSQGHVENSTLDGTTYGMVVYRGSFFGRQNNVFNAPGNQLQGGLVQPTLP